MTTFMLVYGIFLLVLGVVGLAAPSPREKGEHHSPAMIVVGMTFSAVHVYNYARLAGLI